MRIKDGSNQPIDITGWTVSAEARFRTCHVTAGAARGSVPSVTTIMPAAPAIPERPLQSNPIVSESGLVQIEIPADLWPVATHTIPEDATEGLPLVIVTVTIQNTDNPARIWKFRHLILYRPGS